MAADSGLTAGVTGGTRLPRTFFDSNILIYAEDKAYPVKQELAVRLILEHGRQRSGVVSLQVLGEYFSAVTRKLMLDPQTARSQVEFYSRFHLVEPTLGDTLAATDLYRLYGYTYWDSLILQCARQSGCSVLLSEDMQHGQVIDGVKILNPFL
jgi:predicted nucleic acid-binding protein